jgi:hypothetical protein
MKVICLSVKSVVDCVRYDVKLLLVKYPNMHSDFKITSTEVPLVKHGVA